MLLTKSAQFDHFHARFTSTNIRYFTLNDYEYFVGPFLSQFEVQSGQCLIFRLDNVARVP